MISFKRAKNIIPFGELMISFERVKIPSGSIHMYKLNLFRESQNSLRGANNLFQESQTSPRGACYLFRESQNSLRGTNSKLFWEAYKSNNGSKISRLRETNACVNACETALRDSECNDIIYTDYKTYLKRVDSCEPKIPHCVKNHRHSRLYRDCLCASRQYFVVLPSHFCGL